jgi:competence protein ComEC
MKRPLALLAVIFSLGIFLADKIRVTPFWPGLFSVISLCLCLLTLKRKILFEIFLCSLVFLTGAFALKNYHYLPKCHVAKFAYHKNTHIYSIKGYVDSEPLTRGERSIFILRSQEIQLENISHNCCGKLLVYVKGKKEFALGEELFLKGKLSRPFAFGRHEKKSYRDYLYRQGIYAILHADSATELTGQRQKQLLALKRFACWLKSKVESILFRYLPRLPASILDAMVLGEKRGIPPLVYNSMIKSGTVHILVVSGFNVGIVAFIIMLILRLVRLGRRLRILIAIPLVILYCLVTGASNPVLRSTVMAVVFMLSYLFKGEADIYNSLGLAGQFILWFNPAQLFDIGFQLSFVCVFSIAFFYPRIKALFKIDCLRIKYLEFLIEGALISLSSWLGTFIFIAYYFRFFSTVTVIANLFIVPLAGLITLSGFSLVIMALFCPALAHLFAYANEFLVLLLLKINAFLVSLPFAFFSLP